MQPYHTEKPGATVGDSRTDRQRRCGVAGPESTAGLSEWPGLGHGESQRRPRPAPGMRSPARTRREPRARAKWALQLQPPHPAQVTLKACPLVPSRGGRPPLPGTHRYQCSGLPDAPSPQERRRRLCLSPPARRRTKAPPTDRRGHEAMAVGAESRGRGRARSDRRGNVAKAREFTAGLSWGVDFLSN